MHGPCPTVRVVWHNEEGFTEISEHDFDPKKHKLWSENKQPDPLTVEELKEKLTAIKVSFPANAKKEELEKLLSDNTK